VDEERDLDDVRPRGEVVECDVEPERLGEDLAGALHDPPILGHGRERPPHPAPVGALAGEEQRRSAVAGCPLGPGGAEGMNELVAIRPDDGEAMRQGDPPAEERVLERVEVELRTRLQLTRELRGQALHGRGRAGGERQDHPASRGDRRRPRRSLREHDVRVRPADAEGAHPRDPSSLARPGHEL
jgi:hypothetical protein